MARFKFRSNKKNQFNFIAEKDEILNHEILSGVHTEIFLNKNMIIEGCKNIIDYRENYIRLRLKKGYFSIIGSNFLITDFQQEKIEIRGNILSIEFCF